MCYRVRIRMVLMVGALLAVMVMPGTVLAGTTEHKLTVSSPDVVPLPGHKPPPPRKKAYPGDIPLRLISKNEAVSIAIEKAPPASNFKVLRRFHKDRPVYAVFFKAEDGDYRVFVDAETGDIIKP